jgi:membrane-bound lytic murein transglycosylase D
MPNPSRSVAAVRSATVLFSALALLIIMGACHGGPKPGTPATPTTDAKQKDGYDSLTLAAADSAHRGNGVDGRGNDASGIPVPDLGAVAVDLFGDSIMPPLPSIADGRETTAKEEPPRWDIDVRSYETHERVAFYISRFQGEARDRFTVWLERGGRYEPMIRAKLRACRLPEDMVYLALIESGYDVNAYSRAAAVGMWQFMTSTARGTGLRVDWWVDERRDPVRSTDAACKFLGWLNEQFGSLYLAAAAYNGGPGRVSRGLSRYADDLIGTDRDAQFFALADHDALRAETKEYVPKLIAAALVAKQPARYGLTVNYLPPLEYDIVRVPPSTPLAAVAAAAATSVGVITELNPHILRGLTPPKDSFTVRIPPGRALAFHDAFTSLPESSRRPYQKVVSKKGQTMSSLAARGGISASQLAWYNRGLSRTKSGKVTTGQTVLIPSTAVVAAARDVPDPSVERYGSSRGRSVTHVVRSGETLGVIAARYGTSVSSLKRLNGLSGTRIVPGEVLVVKRSSRSYAKKHHKNSSATAAR